MPLALLPPLLRHSLLVLLLRPSLARALRSLRRQPVGGSSARSRRPLPRRPHLASLAVVLSPRRLANPPPLLLPPVPLLQEVACLARSPLPQRLLQVPLRLLPLLPRRLVVYSETLAHQPPLHLPQPPLRHPAEACSGKPRPPLPPQRHRLVLRRLPLPSQLDHSSAAPRRTLHHSRLRQPRQVPLLRPLRRRRLLQLLRPRDPVCSVPSPLKARLPLPRSPLNRAAQLLQPPVPAHSVLRPPGRHRGSLR